MNIDEILEGIGERDLSKAKERVSELILENNTKQFEYIKSNEADIANYIRFQGEYTKSLEDFDSQRVEGMKFELIEKEKVKVEERIRIHQKRMNILKKIQEIEEMFRKHVPSSHSSCEYTVEQLENFCTVEDRFFSEKSELEEELRSSRVYLRYRKKYEKRKRDLRIQIKHSQYLFRFEKTRIRFPQGSMKKYLKVLSQLDMFSPGFRKFFFQAYTTFIRKVIVGSGQDILREGQGMADFLREDELKSEEVEKVENTIKSENESITRAGRVNRRIFGIFRLIEILHLQAFVTENFCTNVRKLVISPLISSLTDLEIQEIRAFQASHKKTIPNVFQEKVFERLHIYQFLSRSEQRIRRIRALLSDPSHVKRFEHLEILLGAYELIECIRNWSELLLVDEARREDNNYLVIRENLSLLLDLFVVSVVEDEGSSGSGLSRGIVSRSIVYVREKIEEFMLSICLKRNCVFRDDLYLILSNFRNILCEK